MVNNIILILLLSLISCNKIKIDQVNLPGLDAPFLNQVPVANDYSFTINHNLSLPIALAATDADGNSLTYSIVTPPSHGTIQGSGGSFTYTPSSMYLGADSFTYKVNDGYEDSNTATVSIEVKKIDEVSSSVNGASASSVAIARNNSAFVVGGAEDTLVASRWVVKHYSGADFSTIRLLENSESPVTGADSAAVNSVAISADGNTVVAGGLVTIAGVPRWLIKRYSGENFSVVETIDNTEMGAISFVSDVVLSNDGTFIVASGMGVTSGNYAWVVKKYSGAGLSTVTTIENTPTPAPGSVMAGATSLDISLDDSSIVVGGWTSGGLYGNWVVKRYRGANFSTIDILENSQGIPSGMSAEITGVSMSDDGRTIAATGAVFDGFTGRWVVKKYVDTEGDNTYGSSILDDSIGTADGAFSSPRSVMVSSNGTKIVVGGSVTKSNSIAKWLVKSYTGSGHATKTILQEVEGTVDLTSSKGVALSSDSQWFLSAGMIETVQGEQWHVASGFMPQ